MMDKGKTWMKLSGAYMDTNSGAPTYADKVAVAQAYIKAAPERVVWGSDWPHPTEKPEHKPNDATLFDLLTEWAPDAAQRQRILVSNPEALYGFAKRAHDPKSGNRFSESDHAQTITGGNNAENRTRRRGCPVRRRRARATRRAAADAAAAAGRLGQDRDQGDRSRQQDLDADRAGREHHGRGRQRRHHHGGRAVRAALRQDQGGDQGDLAAADPLSDQHAFPRRPHRRQRELRQGRRDHRGARQYPRAARGRNRVGHDRREGAAALRRSAAEADLCRRLVRARGRRPQGAAHAHRQRAHRRRHLGLFRRRQCAVDRRHLQQSQALPEHRLHERRRRARHDPRARHLHQGVERHDQDRARPRPARHQGGPAWCSATCW